MPNTGIIVPILSIIILVFSIKGYMCTSIVDGIGPFEFVNARQPINNDLYIDNDLLKRAYWSINDDLYIDNDLLKRAYLSINTVNSFGCKMWILIPGCTPSSLIRTLNGALDSLSRWCSLSCGKDSLLTNCGNILTMYGLVRAL